MRLKNLIMRSLIVEFNQSSFTDCYIKMFIMLFSVNWLKQMKMSTPPINGTSKKRPSRSEVFDNTISPLDFVLLNKIIELADLESIDECFFFKDSWNHIRFFEHGKFREKISEFNLRFFVVLWIRAKFLSSILCSLGFNPKENVFLCLTLKRTF